MRAARAHSHPNSDAQEKAPTCVCVYVCLCVCASVRSSLLFYVYICVSLRERQSEKARRRVGKWGKTRVREKWRYPVSIPFLFIPRWCAGEWAAVHVRYPLLTLWPPPVAFCLLVVMCFLLFLFLHLPSPPRFGASMRACAHVYVTCGSRFFFPFGFQISLVFESGSCRSRGLCMRVRACAYCVAGVRWSFSLFAPSYALRLTAPRPAFFAGFLFGRRSS